MSRNHLGGHAACRFVIYAVCDICCRNSLSVIVFCNLQLEVVKHTTHETYVAQVQVYYRIV